MRSRLLRAAQACAALLLLLAVAAGVRYVRDSRELGATAARIGGGPAPASVYMRRVFRFVVDEITSVTPVPPDAYLFFPIFRPLRATPLQVLEHGGDCAYKARALVVLLDHLGVDASKVVLHDRRGRPKHVVTAVETERGRYYADAQFDLLYERPDGSPMSLEEIRRDLDTIVTGRLAAGDERLSKYHLEKYRYEHTTTIDWQKSTAWRAARGALGLFLDEGELDRLGRPVLLEEPAALVGLASLGGALLTGLMARVAERRPRREEPTRGAT